MPTKTQLKYLSLGFCYLCDVTLVAWFYFRSTNYSRYNEHIGNNLDSPDFQIQLYRILLQSLTFALLLFLAAQTVVYIMALRNFKSAYLYLKVFAVMGFTVSLYITIMSSIYALLPMCIYLIGYYTFAKIYSESKAIVQN